MSFKDKLNELSNALREAETEARGLPNQNLADIIELGRARIVQAMGHPDIDMMGEQPDPTTTKSNPFPGGATAGQSG